MDPSITTEHALAVAGHFDIAGAPTTARRITQGHINDTFDVGAEGRRYIIQRIEHRIFSRPTELMDNIKLVAGEVHRAIAREGGHPREQSLSLVCAKRGRHYIRTNDGSVWRCYLFLEGTIHGFVANDAAGRHIVHEAASAFGRFQRWLADVPAHELADTIPRFHHTPTRYRQLTRAVTADTAGRVAACREVIDHALDQRWVVDALDDLVISGGVPTVVVHNDTKISNVMFPPDGDSVVIDWDTIMPGTRLYDVGDLIRSTVCPVPEDSQDISSIRLEMDLFQELLRGYLSAAAPVITPTEVANIALSGLVLTYTIGIRFLADHLNGDTYFAVEREGHNLDRARAQLARFDALVDRRDELEEMVRSEWRAVQECHPVHFPSRF